MEWMEGAISDVCSEPTYKIRDPTYAVGDDEVGVKDTPKLLGGNTAQLTVV